MPKKDKRPTRIYPDNRIRTQESVNRVTESPAKPTENPPQKQEHIPDKRSFKQRMRFQTYCSGTEKQREKCDNRGSPSLMGKDGGGSRKGAKAALGAFSEL